MQSTTNVKTMDIDLRVLEIMDQIKSLNYTVVITGGYIRDFLLDKESGDYDLATNAPLEEVSELFEDVKPKYLNDTLIMLTIKYEGIKVEVSRFREEVYSVDNQLMFSFVDDFSKDAKRRDISINAIAYDDKFIDPLAGMEDLSNRIIRVIGEPSVRFKEDPLRMLRVLRFAATLGFKIEDKALEYIKANFDEALFNANSSKELKQIIKGQYFDEVYEKIPELFEYISNGKFKNVAIDNRSTLVNDLGLLVYLIYMMRIGSQNKIFEYIQFSKKDIKFALLINNILAELQQKLDYRDVAALFIEYGKDTMLKIYECFSACDFLNQNSVKLIMEVNENSYIRIDELKVSDHDIDSSFTIKEKYEILKDLQSLIVQGKIKNERAVLLKRIEENY